MGSEPSSPFHGASCICVCSLECCSCGRAECCSRCVLCLCNWVFLPVLSTLCTLPFGVELLGSPTESVQGNLEVEMTSVVFCVCAASSSAAAASGGTYPPLSTSHCWLTNLLLPQLILVEGLLDAPWTVSVTLCRQFEGHGLKQYIWSMRRARNTQCLWAVQAVGAS